MKKWKIVCLIVVSLCVILGAVLLYKEQYVNTEKNKGQTNVALEPSQEPTASPSPTISLTPSQEPTASPTPSTSPTPTEVPTKAPTATPTPTKAPTATPTPTKAPTKAPTATPTPTKAPTKAPTATPTPTKAPTATPTPTKAPTATPTPTKAPTKAPTATPTPTKAPTKAPTPTPEPVITFPHEISDVPITIMSRQSYDGIFIEDGSDKEIKGVSTLIIQNTGNAPIEYARIVLKGDKGEHEYIVTALESNGIMIVQEKTGMSYVKDTFRTCTADVAYADAFEMSEGIVSVKEKDNGFLEVTNLSTETIPSVRLFYKFYLADQKVYVGGITYSIKVSELESSKPQEILASHYVAGYSKVIMVKTYDWD